MALFRQDKGRAAQGQGPQATGLAVEELRLLEAAVSKGDWETVKRIASSTRHEAVGLRGVAAAAEKKRWDVLGVAARSARVETVRVLARLEAVDAFMQAGKWDSVLEIGCYGTDAVAAYAVEKVAGKNEWESVRYVGIYGGGKGALRAVELLGKAGKWDLLCEVACNADDCGVAMHAVDVAAEAGRWMDVLRIGSGAKRPVACHVADVIAEANKGRQWKKPAE